MRYILVLVLLLKVGLAQTPTFVAGAGMASATGDSAVTSTFDSTGATFIAVCISGGNASSPSVIDSAGNSYTSLTAVTVAGTQIAQVWYTSSSALLTSAVHTVTVTSTGDAPAIAAVAFSNAGTFDIQYSDSTTSDVTITPGAGQNTGSNNEVSISCLHIDTTSVTPPSLGAGGYTLVASGIVVGGVNYGYGLGYLVQPTSGLGVGTTWNSNGPSADMAGTASLFTNVVPPPPSGGKVVHRIITAKLGR